MSDSLIVAIVGSKSRVSAIAGGRVSAAEKRMAIAQINQTFWFEILCPISKIRKFQEQKSVVDLTANHGKFCLA